MKDSSIYIDCCRTFIDSFGTQNLAQKLKLSFQVVNNWKSRGIPQGWYRYLELFCEKEWRDAGLDQFKD